MEFISLRSRCQIFANRGGCPFFIKADIETLAGIIFGIDGIEVTEIL